MSAQLSFLPWIRQGLTAVQQDGPRPTVAISLQIGKPVRFNAELYGPQDAVALHEGAISRTYPAARGEVSPDALVAIEFARADLPWLLTHARAPANGRHIPWIVLVVVRKQAGVRLHDKRDGSLPVLTIEAPADPRQELPRLSESWAWAHVQIVGALGAAPLPQTLQQILMTTPERAISRLLSPRRLEAYKEYLACVVPAFEIGRAQALGLPTDGIQKLQPAWDVGAALDRIELPVYYQWEFRTTDLADFSHLVRLLKPRPLPADVGARPMSVAYPTSPAPADYHYVTRMAGALTVPRPEPDGSGEPEAQSSRDRFRAALLDLMSTPSAVVPPTYGRDHAARSTGGGARVTAPWLDQLNLDPERRAAAALGARVVQRDQEAIVAAAWDQAGEIRQANASLRHGDLARTTTVGLYYRHLCRMEPGAAVQVSQPAARKAGLEAAARAAGVPDVALSIPFRRLTRAGGPVMRRSTDPSSSRLDLTAVETAPSNPDNRKMATLATPPAGTGLSSSVLAQANIAAITQERIQGAPAQPWFQLTGEDGPVANGRATISYYYKFPPLGATFGPVTRVVDVPWAFEARLGTSNSFVATMFRGHAALQQKYLTDALATAKTPSPRDAATQSMTIEEVQIDMMARLRPATTFKPQTSIAQGTEGEPAAEAMARAAAGPPPAGRMTFTPRFPQAMFPALIEVAPELFVSGLDLVPHNSVSLLQANRKFIEAFMVGLNHEAISELLWRGFPVPRSATLFRSFWGQAGEIQHIPAWTRDLGENNPEAEASVLLLRGDLIRAHPRCTVYAVPAATDGRPSTAAPLVPRFITNLDAQTAVIGFRESMAFLKKPPGHYFVLEEQATEPRFSTEGLAAPAEPGGHVRVAELVLSSDPTRAAAATAAQVAEERLRLPLRVAIHVNQMIP